MPPFTVTMKAPRPQWWHPLQQRRHDRRLEQLQRTFNSLYSGERGRKINETIRKMATINALYGGDLMIPLPELDTSSTKETP